MAAKDRLTNNSDETDIASLMSGDSIFSIPYFQRPYKWKKDKIRQLNSDILNLVDESSDFHFLGAMIVHGRRSNPSDPDIYDVIDGQQRVTTLYLYICATVKILCDLGRHSDAAGLFLKYLVINRDIKTSNLKLHPGKDDRGQLNSVFDDLLKDTELTKILSGFRLRKLPTTSSVRQPGPLYKNFRLALDFLREEYKQGEVERIESIYRCMLNKMSVVQIDVKDPTSGPKIFDSLNSRQEPMTIGDLVRNEIFSRVADEKPEDIEQVDQDCWQPFYKKFEVNSRNIFDSYFFPFGLIENPNLKKSDVYAYLRKAWLNRSNPAEIVADLSAFQDSFLDIQTGSNNKMHAKLIHEGFRRLWSLGAPNSTYPFLMQLSNKAASQEVSEENCLGVLDAIESFLVRRAICGIEPTGLHAVFKRLWVDCAGDVTQNRVVSEISKHKTVSWPDQAETKAAVLSRSLYQSNITRFLLTEYDRSLGGDVPSNDPWVEHILPQNPDAEWYGSFSEKEKSDLVDTLANLLPLSSNMNSSIGNKPYSFKRSRYADDAMFKSARQFGAQVSDWTPQALRERADLLSDWIVKRWSIEPLQ